MLCWLFRINVHFPSNCGLLVCNTGGLDGVLPHLAGPSRPPPPSHAGRGCPRTPAWSPLQVVYTPRNGRDCAAVARPSVDRSQFPYLRARRASNSGGDYVKPLLGPTTLLTVGSMTADDGGAADRRGSAVPISGAEAESSTSIWEGTVSTR